MFPEPEVSVFQPPKVKPVLVNPLPSGRVMLEPAFAVWLVGSVPVPPLALKLTV